MGLVCVCGEGGGLELVELGDFFTMKPNFK